MLILDDRLFPNLHVSVILLYNYGHGRASLWVKYTYPNLHKGPGHEISLANGILVECGYGVWLAFFSLDDSPWEENAFNKVTAFQAGSSRIRYAEREGHMHWAIAGPRADLYPSAV